MTKLKIRILKSERVSALPLQQSVGCLSSLVEAQFGGIVNIDED